MTSPVPTPEPTPPTQVKHPWRAVARSAVAFALGLVSLIPQVIAIGHFEALPGATQALAVSLTITRILAIPGVNDLLVRFVPWLAAAPPTS